MREIATAVAFACAACCARFSARAAAGGGTARYFASDDATISAVGLTHRGVRVANPASPRRAVNLKLLVDCGALYSVIPEKVLRRIGVDPHSSRTSYLADGTEITRGVGDVVFILNDHRGASPVIFGEDDDSALRGVVSLGALGLILDPMKRVLRPVPMVLG